MHWGGVGGAFAVSLCGAGPDVAQRRFAHRGAGRTAGVLPAVGERAVRADGGAVAPAGGVVGVTRELDTRDGGGYHCPARFRGGGDAPDVLWGPVAQSGQSIGHLIRVSWVQIPACLHAHAIFNCIHYFPLGGTLQRLTPVFSVVQVAKVLPCPQELCGG